MSILLKEKCGERENEVEERTAGIEQLAARCFGFWFERRERKDFFEGC